MNYGDMAKDKGYDNRIISSPIDISQLEKVDLKECNDIVTMLKGDVHGYIVWLSGVLSSSINADSINLNDSVIDATSLHSSSGIFSMRYHYKLYLGKSNPQNTSVRELILYAYKPLKDFDGSNIPEECKQGELLMGSVEIINQLSTLIAEELRRKSESTPYTSDLIVNEVGVAWGTALSKINQILKIRLEKLV